MTDCESVRVGVARRGSYWRPDLLDKWPSFGAGPNLSLQMLAPFQMVNVGRSLSAITFHFQQVAMDINLRLIR